MPPTTAPVSWIGNGRGPGAVVDERRQGDHQGRIRVDGPTTRDDAAVRTGAWLVEVRLMVNCCWAVLPAGSAAWTSTLTAGPCDAEGVHWIRPVLGLMVIPAARRDQRVGHRAGRIRGGRHLVTVGNVDGRRGDRRGGETRRRGVDRQRKRRGGRAGQVGRGAQIAHGDRLIRQGLRGGDRVGPGGQGHGAVGGHVHGSSPWRRLAADQGAVGKDVDGVAGGHAGDVELQLLPEPLLFRSVIVVEVAPEPGTREMPVGAAGST